MTGIVKLGDPKKIAPTQTENLKEEFSLLRKWRIGACVVGLLTLIWSVLAGFYTLYYCIRCIFLMEIGNFAFFIFKHTFIVFSNFGMAFVTCKVMFACYKRKDFDKGEQQLNQLNSEAEIIYRFRISGLLYMFYQMVAFYLELYMYHPGPYHLVFLAIWLIGFEVIQFYWIKLRCLIARVESNDKI